MGPIPALFYGFNRAMEKLRIGPRIYYYRLFAQPVSNKSIVPPALGRTINVRPIAKNDPAFAFMPVPPHIVSQRLAQSAYCIGAFKDQELVAYLWICPGPYEEDEVRCRFVPLPEGKAVWDFDVYVLPRHRMGLAFARLWSEANHYLNRRDVIVTYSRVSAFNSMSLRSHQSLNAQKVGTALFFVAGRLQLTISTRPPYVHISARNASRPTISLSRTQLDSSR